MTARGVTESIVEEAALAWLESLGYAVAHGPDVAAGMPGAEPSDPNYRDVVLEGRLHQALVRLNPDLSAEALDDAFRKLTRTNLPSLLPELISGVPHKKDVGTMLETITSKSLPSSTRLTRTSYSFPLFSVNTSGNATTRSSLLTRLSKNTQPALC